MEGGPMFRFTIRELLILTVTAGLAVSWWLDRSSLASRLRTTEDLAQAAIEKIETWNYLNATGRMPPD
jgi:hypothetical protein